MSIKNQAMFWLRNVCDFPDEIMKSEIHDNSLLEGLKEFGSLMKRVYSDYQSYEVSTVESVQTKIGIMADDLENYHNLTDLGLCLYCIASVSQEHSEGAVSFLRLEKSLFKKNFKKLVTFFINMLEKYDFYFRYFKNGKEVDAYQLCNTFEVYYESNASLMAAMKYLSDRLPAVEVKADYAGRTTLFLMADYESIIVKKSTKRSEVEPSRAGICNTAGDKKELWLKIVDKIKKEFGLDTDISVNPYVFPHWAVKCLRKKKTVCTFQIYSDYIKIRLPLTYDAAKDLITRRIKLPRSIRECIQSFHCIGCGKCSDQSNIEIYEGIHLCRLDYSNFITEDSRCIHIAVQTEEEAAVIYDILKNLLVHK